MKIAFFHELQLGGARRAANEFAKQLKKNYQVDLYTIGEKKEHIEEYTSFTDVYFYKFIHVIWKGRNWKAKFYMDTIELLKLYFLHKKISQDINKIDYDCAFIHGSKYTQAPFILRFIKSKKIYYCQEPLRMVYEDHFFKPKLNTIRRIYENLNRFIRKKTDSTNLRKANLILANSYFTKKNILSAYNVVSKVCYMGIDASLFIPKKIKKDIDILFVGAKDTLNGYPLFINSINRIKNQELNIEYLEGDEKWLTDNDLINLYNRSKVIISFGYNEPFGLVPLEAMACRVPIIALDEGGYRETVINNQTGFLVPRDLNKIAEKIKLLLSNPTIAKKVGANGRREILNKWRWEKRINNLESILLEAKK